MRTRVIRLPSDLCDEDSNWDEFLKHCAGVIEDGSLSCGAQDHGLTHVQKVIFTKGRPLSDTLVPFDLLWRIVLLNGKSLTVNVNARPVEGCRPSILTGVHFD